MSGHSKWHKIKHQKEAADKKKGQLFGKFAKEIAVLARGEKDPNKNAALRDAIARAKKANMPQANIDRLLSGTSEPLQTITYEGFGPGGAALLIATQTDNPNRTVNELRTVLRDEGGRLGEIGTVRWKFTADHKPTYPLTLSPEDKASLTSLIESIQNHPDVTAVYSDVQ